MHFTILQSHAQWKYEYFEQIVRILLILLSSINFYWVCSNVYISLFISPTQKITFAWNGISDSISRMNTIHFVCKQIGVYVANVNRLIGKKCQIGVSMKRFNLRMEHIIISIMRRLHSQPFSANISNSAYSALPRFTCISTATAETIEWMIVNWFSIYVFIPFYRYFVRLPPPQTIEICFMALARHQLIHGIRWRINILWKRSAHRDWIQFHF